MENSVKSNITYTLEGCYNPHAPFRLRNWVIEYELLSENDMRILARVFGFNKKSVQKLVTGPEKFRYIKIKGVKINKVIHIEPISCRSFTDNRQPANIRTELIISRLDKGTE